RACGYNLRGGDPHGACPECGTAVGFSLVDDRLKFADPGWVSRLAAGSGWILTGLILYVLLWVVMAGFDDVIGGWRWAVQFFRSASLTLCILLGCWLLTTGEPVERNRPDRRRLMARRIAVTSGIVGIGYLCLLTFYRGMDVGLWFVVGIAALQTVLDVSELVAMMLWVCVLLARMPSPRLSMQMRVVLIGLALHELGQWAGVFGGAWARWGVILSAWAGLILGVWVVVLLFVFDSRLRAAVDEANDFWARVRGQNELPRGGARG
ncbi:MAG: hypothetical protein GVY24_08430, partial [Planctomycetes bacterium]|nr:hypothetical protein [Planctomycetota bacterium]